ncbi:MAG: hypothetical protein WA009_17570 [Phototrophicaceae bacterium]
MNSTLAESWLSVLTPYSLVADDGTVGAFQKLVRASITAVAVV